MYIRTAERVVLNNACEEDLFEDNPEARSCAPVLAPVNKQSRMIGADCLEDQCLTSVHPEKNADDGTIVAVAAISLRTSGCYMR
jgi:hypothetical protein